MLNVQLKGQNEDLDTIYFALNNVDYGLEHSGELLDCDGIRFEQCPFIIEIDQDWENETTHYTFSEFGFVITDNCGEISLNINIDSSDLLEARKNLGLTQTELAHQLGWTSKRQIAKLESGDAQCTSQTALAIETLLRRKGICLVTYEQLQLQDAEKIDTALEGTCVLYDLGGIEYVVLEDNTVITRAEDLLDDPIFPN